MRVESSFVVGIRESRFENYRKNDSIICGSPATGIDLLVAALSSINQMVTGLMKFIQNTLDQESNHQQDRNKHGIPYLFL